MKTDDDDIGDVTIVEQEAIVFDCEDGEDSLKVTTSPQSLYSVKVNEKKRTWTT